MRYSELIDELIAFDESYKREHGIVAGIDEAGRGPLAGPVVAAAVILDKPIPGLYDSKNLNRQTRKELYDEIIATATVGVGIASAEEIDLYNILKATRLAMIRAVENLAVRPDFVIIDGRSLKVNVKGTCVVSGDKKSASIAAASIVAKVTRDRIMEKLHHLFPQYGFEVHKGYGTKEHIKALKQYGPSLWHRLTFKPVKEVLTHDVARSWLLEKNVSERRLFRAGIL
ncbi:ribonuclease HII [Kosmotoga pacifica]|uniref:Ribonuclease HII n=1 Tax=Kosmotoga pacifica TaxID=1330330 RepID=A0A0G2ZEI2_9BACT|nr:ribonuclease HII [Kosmotoga pacifica]AKI97949.1 ribonuclease HII [Kosmotoga pacifica]